MKDVRDAIANVLDNTSLEEAVRRADQAALKKSGAPSYDI
jgi:hypothetical protein